MVSTGCFSLLLKAHSLKDCCILASTHTQNKNKNKKRSCYLFIYLFCVCMWNCGWFKNFLWYETKQYQNTWNTRTLAIPLQGHLPWHKLPTQDKNSVWEKIKKRVRFFFNCEIYIRLINLEFYNWFYSCEFYLEYFLWFFPFKEKCFFT